MEGQHADDQWVAGLRMRNDWPDWPERIATALEALGVVGVTMQYDQGGPTEFMAADEVASLLEGMATCAIDELLRPLVTLVEEQAKDDGLWFEAKTAPEGYLQQELRKLHAAIERMK
jgi:hypothetical protein